MAGVPQNFSAISNVLANYDFVDIASGTGYINFYAGNTVDLKLLSNFTYYSDVIVTSYTGTHASYALTLDHDYDIVLNRPLDLRGLAIVNVPLYDASVDTSIYVKVLLRKWDGTTETEIISNDSRVLKATATHSTMSIDLNVPLTHFKKGETLRLSINIYAKDDGGAHTVNLNYAHDPKGRTTGWDGTGAVPSLLTFQCPVRLNL